MCFLCPDNILTNVLSLSLSHTHTRTHTHTHTHTQAVHTRRVYVQCVGSRSLMSRTISNHQYDPVHNLMIFRFLFTKTVQHFYTCTTLRNNYHHNTSLIVYEFMLPLILYQLAVVVTVVPVMRYLVQDKSGPPSPIFACEIRTTLAKCGLIIQKLAAVAKWPLSMLTIT